MEVPRSCHLGVKNPVKPFPIQVGQHGIVEHSGGMEDPSDFRQVTPDLIENPRDINTPRYVGLHDRYCRTLRFEVGGKLRFH